MRASEGGSSQSKLSPRVALVHDWLTGMRGGEKVLEAIAAQFPGAPIFTLFHFPGSVSDALEGRPIHTSFLQRAPWLRRRYRHYLPLFPAAVEDLDLSGYDLVVSTSHCVAKGVLPDPGAYHLCYCHTPMRYAWDQERTYFPRRHGPVARLRGQILSRLRAWDVASSPRVDHFLANSSFVARRIRRYYGREATVVPPPVDVDFFTPDPELPPDTAEASAVPTSGAYALMVSALAPYKRVDLAIQACRDRGLELRVVGTGPEHRRLERLGGAGTRFLGHVTGEALRDLYRGAAFYLQPGVEDFGIATVEALACGTPVVALDAGGVRDIVEDGAHGVLYRPWEAAGVSGDPQAPEAHQAALSAAIDKVRHMGFNRLDLRSRAEKFSPDNFARRLESALP